jgi:copper(I)-binding protein
MREFRIAVLAATAALVLAVAACGDDDAEHGTVTVSDVWSRASAATQAAGVVYFDITAGESGDALVGAAVSSEIAASAELHETVAVDSTTTSMSHDMGGSTMAGHDMGDMGGAMAMQPVSSVHVGAGETVSFEPGGYHVMLMGLTAPLIPGQTFEVTLTFEHAGEVVVVAEVRS